MKFEGIYTPAITPHREDGSIDRDAFVAELGAAYRDVIGRHFPTMSAVQVAGLVEDRARVEIEVTAVVPE